MSEFSLYFNYIYLLCYFCCCQVIDERMIRLEMMTEKCKRALRTNEKKRHADYEDAQTLAHSARELWHKSVTLSDGAVSMAKLFRQCGWPHPDISNKKRHDAQWIRISPADLGTDPNVDLKQKLTAKQFAAKTALLSIQEVERLRREKLVQDFFSTQPKSLSSNSAANSTTTTTASKISSFKLTKISNTLRIHPNAVNETKLECGDRVDVMEHYAGRIVAWRPGEYFFFLSILLLLYSTF